MRIGKGWQAAQSLGSAAFDSSWLFHDEGGISAAGRQRALLEISYLPSAAEQIVVAVEGTSAAVIAGS